VQVVKIEIIKPDINTGGQPMFGDDPVFLSRKKVDGNGPPVGLEAPVAAVRAPKLDFRAESMPKVL
jgi:hypothetical protein